MTNELLTSGIQQLDAPEFVFLYMLDVTALGGGIQYWTPRREGDDEPIVFQGNTYVCTDIQIDEVDLTTSGTLPRPQITIGNADGLVGALLVAYDDIKGCQVTRMRVRRDCLDGQENADVEADWPIDIFRVERPVSRNKNKVVIELAAATDNMGAKVPGRPILRNVCSWIYRRWDGTAFNYESATCPYAGTAFYTRLGKTCASSKDCCGKRVSDCKLRYPSEPLPFGGFPGVAKVRTS